METNRKKDYYKGIEDARKRIIEGKGCITYCHAVYGGSMVVHPDGNVYPCGSLSGSEKYYMGNIYDLSSKEKLELITIKLNPVMVVNMKKFV